MLSPPSATTSMWPTPTHLMRTTGRRYAVFRSGVEDLPCGTGGDHSGRDVRLSQSLRARRRGTAYPLSQQVRVAVVSIRIYDFAMMPVRTLLQHASRTPDREHDEVWDGKNDDGKQVANGVYYIEVTVDDASPVWTKAIALQ
jgi:hypothetical protein